MAPLGRRLFRPDVRAHPVGHCCATEPIASRRRLRASSGCARCSAHRIAWARSGRASCYGRRFPSGRSRPRSPPHLRRRWLLRRADRVIVNGASGERYVRRFGVPDTGSTGSRARRCPPSVRPIQFRDETAQCVICCSPGWLSGAKGSAPFVEALNEWTGAHPGDSVKMTIVGSGTVLPTLQGIWLRGSLSFGSWESRIPRPFRRSSRPQMCSYSRRSPTNGGVVVNEAMAAGLPVLGGFHSQAVEELCEEGKTG